MPKREETHSFVDEWKSLWKSDLDALGGYNGATSDPTRIDPKVLEWAKHNCSHEPHFIKVINSNAANCGPGHMYGSRKSRRLTVPKPFVEEHFRELNRVVTLENEEGKKWKVSFGEVSSHPCWQQGWRRLVMDHDLQPGEVIVFILVGNSHFRFTRFDEDGNILSIPQNNSQSPGSVTKSHPRTSWKLKRAAALASEDDHSNDSVSDYDTRSFGLDFDIGHGHGSPLSLEITEDFCKKRRLERVEEIKSKGDSDLEELRVNKEHDSDEAAGSTSTAGNPSTITIEAH